MCEEALPAGDRLESNRLQFFGEVVFPILSGHRVPVEGKSKLATRAAVSRSYPGLRPLGARKLDPGDDVRASHACTEFALRIG